MLFGTVVAERISLFPSIRLATDGRYVNEINSYL